MRRRAPDRELSISTSLLYHAFGIRGYEYTRTDYQGGQAAFTIRQDPKTCRRSACGSLPIPSRGRVGRRFRTVPIGRRATFVALPIPRLECRACGVARQLKIPFADPRRSYTSSFERHALGLGRRMTIRDLALHLGVGRDVIKDIQEGDLSRRLARPKLKHLKRIAIDEIAVARGRPYSRLVMDPEGGAAVFVGDGQGADAPKPSWKRLRPGKARIGAVAVDMSAAYRGAVSTHLPGAKVVFDRFHVVKLFKEELSDLRRAVHREATDVLHKAVLEGTRWLLLKGPEDLETEKGEKRRLREALALKKPLATAYYLKDDLRRPWERPGKGLATTLLDGRIGRAEGPGIKMLGPMARTPAGHRAGLPANGDVMITSVPMEGTDEKIETMKRPAYGFRDRELFELKILAIHETKYAPIG